MNADTKYRIALGMVPGVGSQIAELLISYAGSGQKVFDFDDKKLTSIPGIHKHIAQNLYSHRHLISIAEKEIRFMEQEGVTYLGFDDASFPRLLKECPDAPFQLFFKGSLDALQKKNIAIVGTRRASSYGKSFTQALIKRLSSFDINIVSGLAYGIDICAHQEALKNNLSTTAVVAHGLDRIYPFAHKNTANAMKKSGGIITEFLTKTNPDRENFPKRNRIVAGMCENTIVIEAAEKGGALITADIAFSYDRSVLALPGRINDEYSKGCNKIIASQQAQMITDIDHCIELLKLDRKVEEKQTQLFPELSSVELKILNLFTNDPLPVEQLFHQLNLNLGQLNNHLFQMEMKSLIRKLPGNLYEKCAVF